MKQEHPVADAIRRAMDELHRAGCKPVRMYLSDSTEILLMLECGYVSKLKGPRPTFFGLRISRPFAGEHERVVAEDGTAAELVV